MENSTEMSTMMPWSVPSFLLGLHVLQGVVVGMNVPSEQSTNPKSMEQLPNSMTSGHVDIKRLVPRKRQLRPQRLLRKLGKEFDPFWMSKDLPSDFLDIATKHNTDKHLIPESKSRDLTNLIQSLHNSIYSKVGHDLYNNDSFNNSTNKNNSNTHDSALSFKDEMLLTIQNWLVEYSSCPVYYQWQDLGLLYWPRWVRRGMCSRQESEWNELDSASSSSSSSSSNKQSCSWPPGMHCVPDRPKKLKILRWTCRHSKVSDSFHRFRESGRRKDSSQSTRLDKEHHNDMEQNLSLEDDIRDIKPVDNSLDIHEQDPSDTNDLDKAILSQTGLPRQHRDISLTHVLNDEGHDWSIRSLRTKRSRGSDVINKTTTWRKGSKWKGKRKHPHVRCRWVRIPYPVVDECYCSC